MISNRTKERISGTLSGWYTMEWSQGAIHWDGDKLLVKGESLADEIAYNLSKDFDRKITTHPTGNDGWVTVEFQ